jgi:predicted nuclease of predicted toxin-antitoxin system
MMTFLANENFPRPSILLLRQKGYAVLSVQEASFGISDEVVMQTAIDSGLIILTFDSDYGELIFKYAAINPPSVIFFREKGTTPYFAGNALLDILQKGDLQLAGAFTVVEKTNIRQRFYRKM